MITLPHLEAIRREWLENAVLIPSAWAKSGGFGSTFSPLFDVYALDQKPQEE